MIQIKELRINKFEQFKKAIFKIKLFNEMSNLLNLKMKYKLNQWNVQIHYI